MRTHIVVFALLLAGVLGGCKKDDGGTGSGTTTVEDWNFPANPTKFAATLYTEKVTVAVNEAFDVKLVLYNIPDVFGAAVEMSYPSGTVDIIGDGIGGPHFTPATDILAVSKIEAAQNRASYGVTYRSGTNRSSSGSGVMMKFKCRAKAAGTASFTINPLKLEVKRADGTPVANFANLQLESLAVTVQ